MIPTIKPKSQTEISDWTDSVKEIIRRGNVAEVKREKDNVVVIEIKRQVKNKTAING